MTGSHVMRITCINGSVNGNMFIIVDTPLVDGLRSNKNPKNKIIIIIYKSVLSLSLSYQAMISVVLLLIF